MAADGHLLVDLQAVDDPAAQQRLRDTVYGELRVVAAAHLRGERGAHTLQPTALVHEAYVRMLGATAVDASSRTRFFALAAATMRRVLVDHARRRDAVKRGGGEHTISLTGDVAVTRGGDVDVLALHEALARLAQFNQRQARIVEMRFFAGLGDDEIAAELGISRRSVQGDWAMARAVLFDLLGGRGDSA